MCVRERVYLCVCVCVCTCVCACMCKKCTLGPVKENRREREWESRVTLGSGTPASSAKVAMKSN